MIEHKRLGVIEKTLLDRLCRPVGVFRGHWRIVTVGSRSSLALSFAIGRHPHQGKFSTAYNKQNDFSAYHSLHYAAC